MQNDHWAPRTRIFLGHQRIEETYQLVCRAEVTGDRSLNCGRCQAICPQGAVTVGAIDETMSEFVTFRGDSNWFATANLTLVNLCDSWPPDVRAVVSCPGLLLNFTKLIGRPELALYYREYYETVKEGLEEFDRLFHGAPCLRAGVSGFGCHFKPHGQN